VLTLPYAISANVYWRSYVFKGNPPRVITHVSPEAKTYKHECAWIAKAAGIRTPIKHRVTLDITLYPKRPKDAEARIRKNATSWDDDVQCIDLDNCLKTTIDALKGVVYDDDKWVWAINARRAEPDGAARLVLVVESIEPKGALL